VSGLRAAAGATRRSRQRAERALEQIRDLGEQGWAVSWSAGKDSSVLLDLAAQAWTTGLVVTWANHAMPHELDRLAGLWAARAPHLDYVIRPTIPAITSPHDVTIAPDDRQRADRACHVRLARRLGVQGWLVGLRADESARRRRIARTTAVGGRYQSGPSWGSRPVLCPLLHWTSDQIWQYTQARGLPVHATYHQGARRSPYDQPVA
jgi:3'-phosphoadenosine 5'-phosphosulfate sulfotransferase (PAPS reductase)/FAD synthetase